MRQFNDWLATLPHKYKIVIAGNHELSFDDTFVKRAGMDIVKDSHRTPKTGDGIGTATDIDISEDVDISYIPVTVSAR